MDLRYGPRRAALASGNGNRSPLSRGVSPPLRARGGARIRGRMTLVEGDAPPLEPLPPVAESMDLVRRSQQGDRDALGELVRRYDDRVRRIVSIRMGAQFRGLLDSLDLTQDTWVAALRGLSGFELRDHGS